MTHQVLAPNMPVVKEETHFLVDTYSDPVLLKICGRATYLNCAPLREFLNAILAKGQERFVFDFSECTGMDSTVLGVLAGLGLELKNQGGSAVLCNLSKRNLELVRNLGLHHVLDVDSGSARMHFNEECAEPLQHEGNPAIRNARILLEAHNNLIAVEEGNRSKFQDVLVYLQKRIEG